MGKIHQASMYPPFFVIKKKLKIYEWHSWHNSHIWLWTNWKLLTLLNFSYIAGTAERVINQSWFFSFSFIFSFKVDRLDFFDIADITNISVIPDIPYIADIADIADVVTDMADEAYIPDIPYIAESADIADIAEIADIADIDDIMTFLAFLTVVHPPWLLL